MNIDRWKKLKEEYKEDDLEGTDAARKKRARQTPGQETMESCDCVNEEEKKGPLNKIMRDSGGNKKFKVYVRDPSTGNIKTVRFGDPNMEIKRDDPERRANFRARHNCDNPGPKTKARYWSCRQWRAGAKVEDDFKPTGNFIRESLKDWFGKGGEGGAGGGGWDRYNTEGERIGKCGEGEEGEAYAACLSSEKAAKLGKKGRASFVRRKRAAQKAAGDPKKGKGEEGETKTSKAPTRVETGTREKTNEGWSEKYKRSIDCDNPKGFSQRAHCQGREKDMKESREDFGRRMLREAHEKGYLVEKNVPTNPELYARVKAEAKRKFDVYPSAYANGWLVREYKKRGGGYRKGKGD
tara:strand:+ start:247 stop:1302 length:1056 start_codon:yes stop_codon:yes gene_type:complete